MSRRLDTRDRYGQGADKPLPVALTRIRVGDRDGIELMLSDAPDHAVVRIVGERAQLGPNRWLLRPSHHIAVSTGALPQLAQVAATWRQRRLQWPGYVNGMRAPGYGSRRAMRYPAGRWDGEVVDSDKQWRPGEREFRALAAPSGEAFGPLEVGVVMENLLGERVGLALRFLNNSCVTVVRTLLVVSDPWPRQTRDFESLATLLVTNSYQPGDDSLGYLDAAAEFDRFSAGLLEACDEPLVAKQLLAAVQ